MPRWGTMCLPSPRTNIWRFMNSISIHQLHAWWLRLPWYPHYNSSWHKWISIESLEIKPFFSAGAKNSLLTSFSVYTNGKKLLSTKRRPGTITCLDGIRFLSICWIIFGHTFFMEVIGVKLDKSHIPKVRFISCIVHWICNS